MSARACPLKSKARGSGLEAAEAGVRAEFEIALFDEFGNPAEMFRHGYNQEFVEPADVPLNITLCHMLPGGGRGPPVEVSTVSCGFIYGSAHRKSTFAVGYTVFNTTPLLLQLTVAGRDMFASPKKIPVAAGVTNALYSLVSGDGLQGGSLRNGTISKTLTIEARDEYENKKFVGGDRFQVSLALRGGTASHLPVKDNGNGTYACAYTVDKAGTYSLSITLAADPLADTILHVACSPYHVCVSPDPAGS
jgi:hypothetical protein